jgi:hypothetical protein
MASRKRIQFSTIIAAPVSRVFELMIEPQTYRQWTSAFMEGSCFEGSWQQGQRIRFLGPGGDGMVSEIAENRRDEFISIRHLGFVAQGVEDTTSEAARAWAGAYENYTFAATPEGTLLRVDQDVAAEVESDLAEAWPKALARLKALCEERPGP